MAPAKLKDADGTLSASQTHVLIHQRTKVLSEKAEEDGAPQCQIHVPGNERRSHSRKGKSQNTFMSLRQNAFMNASLNRS